MKGNKKCRRTLAMGVVLVCAMLVSGQVLAAERAAVRTVSTAGEGGGSGFGFYVPNSYTLPVSVSGLSSDGDVVSVIDSNGNSVGSFTIPTLYSPTLLLGYKFNIRGIGSVEPVVGLYYVSASDGGTVSTLGFAMGGKFFYEFVRGSFGNVYAGGTALLEYASRGFKDGSEVTDSAFGLNVLGNIGVEIFPFESLKKIGFTFDAGIPVLGFLSVTAKDPARSQSITKINLLENGVVFSVGVHIYP